MLSIDANMGSAWQSTKRVSDEKLAGLRSVVVKQGTGAYCVISFCISRRNMGLGGGAGISQMPG